MLKGGIKASWQQISDYGYRAVFVKVQWDFPCDGYKKMGTVPEMIEGDVLNLHKISPGG